jgi:predicted transcriptional regulator
MSKPLVNVTIRLDAALVERLDALAAVLQRPGRGPVRTDAILAALYAGLEAFERDPGLIEQAKTKSQGKVRR